MKTLLSILAYILTLGMMSGAAASIVIFCTIFIYFRPAHIGGTESIYPALLMLLLAAVIAILTFIPGYYLTGLWIKRPAIVKLSHNKTFAIAIIPALILSYFIVLLALSIEF